MLHACLRRRNDPRNQREHLYPDVKSLFGNGAPHVVYPHALLLSMRTACTRPSRRCARFEGDDWVRHVGDVRLPTRFNLLRWGMCSPLPETVLLFISSRPCHRPAAFLAFSNDGRTSASCSTSMFPTSPRMLSTTCHPTLYRPTQVTFQTCFATHRCAENGAVGKISSGECRRVVVRCNLLGFEFETEKTLT